MEASALKYQAGIGLHARSPLLRLQSDERLITLLRRGNTGAFEVLFARYESRLLSFCRHLLGSREDAEDVLQEVMTAAFHAIVADERPINVRPWLYRIARNRSLNHLRRTQAIGVDSMDHHFSENGASTADKVHDREQFRLLVGDIQELPETQRTALVLREMDALSYDQIAEAMETTVSSVKSLLVRARMGLAEAAEARQLSCEQVRMELAEVAEGLQKKPSPLVRRHMKGCTRCADFRTQLKATNKALAALLPVGPFIVFKKLAFLHLGHSAGASAGAGSGATAGAGAAGAGAAGAGAGAAGAGAAIGSGVFGGGSMVSAGMGAVATKAAAGLAAAVIVTAGAVEVDHQSAHHPAAPVASVPSSHPASPIAPVHPFGQKPSSVAVAATHAHHAAAHRTATVHQAAAVHRTVSAHPAKTASTTPTSAPTTATAAATTTTPPTTATTATTTVSATPTTTTTTPATTDTTTTTPGRVQTQTDPTILPTTTTTSEPTVPAGTATGTGTTTGVGTGTATTTGAPTTTTGTATTTGTGTATTPTAAGGTTSGGGTGRRRGGAGRTSPVIGTTQIVPTTLP